ncbi:non-muscle caldesmon isoform X1 [Denticeps clupeoides]|uniref:non-muscle caldesmon isoform X1 n=1 Tax=Denticeps clupeoides TaxID=299321 RepID=UPI0010A53399|nr:non-muscle caldesmon-like isoform X1 [Denticeps clupeoides]
MSSAILRRNSSKQGLQNLLRVTAQRSIEDAEEIERERRRRAREAFRNDHNLSGSGGSPQDSEPSAEACQYDGDLKPSDSLTLEEDEGFSDWTQRLERGGKNCQGPEAEKGILKTTKQAETCHRPTSTQRHQTQDRKAEETEAAMQSVRKTSERRKDFGKKGCSQSEREEIEKNQAVTRPAQKKEMIDCPEKPEKTKENRSEIRVSYKSNTVQHDGKPNDITKDSTGGELSTYQVKARRIFRTPSQTQEPKAEETLCLETEQKLEKIRRSHQEKESQELEQLKQKQLEAEMELVELKRRREQRRRVREEEERRKEEEEYQRLAKEEEEKRRMREDIERRRMEAAEKRMKTMSCSDGEEPFSPLSPKSPTVKAEDETRLTPESTCSITEKTDSLNRSLKKSNSFKKTQPPMLLSRIDDKLEQYAHAIESSTKEVKPAKPVVMDVMSPTEPVASKKSLFEAGEAWNQSLPRSPMSKDTDGLKVGVAGLITQWVKSSPDGPQRNSTTRPTDVKPGDVLQKKNLWEIIGEGSLSGRAGPGGKGTPSGKRYKFIVTGHGKYEKIPADNENDSDFTNGKAGKTIEPAKLVSLNRM